MPRYQMTFTVLSPIHIGTGEEILPFEYVMIRDSGNGFPFLVRIDLPRFLAGLTPDQRRQFDYANQQGSIGYMRSFIRKHVDPLKYRLYSPTVSETLFDLYQDELDSSENQLAINLTMRRPDGQPLIPGSSIKGAIRTAVVSQVLADKAKKTGYRPDANDRSWEGDVLGYQRDIRQDPFRAVLVDDITLPNDSVTVDKATILKRNGESGSDPSGIAQYYERIFSKLDKEDVAGTGCLAIRDALARQDVKERGQWRKAVSRPLSAEDLARCCRQFYLPKMREEHQKFYQTSRDLDKANRLLVDRYGQESHYGPLEFPIRLGHFSHCECVTVDHFRKPKTRKGKSGGLLPSGTTRTLCRISRKVAFPFGWAKIRLQEI